MKSKFIVYSLLNVLSILSLNHAQAGTCPPHANYDECVKAEDETRQSKKREATEDRDMFIGDRQDVFRRADSAHEKGVSDCARTCKKNNEHKDNGTSQHKSSAPHGSEQNPIVIS